MIFKYDYYRSTDHFTCDITPKRKVKNYELEIYDSGTGCASINNTSYPHSENMFLLAKPGQERFTIGSFNCYAIHFNCTDPDLCKILDCFPDCTVIDSETKKQLIKFFEQASSELNLQTVTAVFNMLNLIAGSFHSASNKIKTIPKRIANVKEFIDNNYQSAVDLDMISEKTGLSVNYIRKLFCDYYGVSIQKYIIELRLSFVKKLLISTDKSMCEIAYESGFNSQSHMNYMFKHRFGISPLKFKSEHLK